MPFVILAGEPAPCALRVGSKRIAGSNTGRIFAVEFCAARLGKYTHSRRIASPEVCVAAFDFDVRQFLHVILYCGQPPRRFIGKRVSILGETRFPILETLLRLNDFRCLAISHTHHMNGVAHIAERGHVQDGIDPFNKKLD